MRATWLANVLRLAGLQVVEMAGWKDRGRELVSINGVILHHTATGTNWADSAVGKLLRDGRTDLPGPLAQLGLDRSGKFWIVAAGKCNHNGFGEHGNQTLGIEAYNDGRGEPWPDVQLDAWQRGTAAILRHCGLSEGHALGHRESDPQRKIDPFGVDLPRFRRAVAYHLTPPLPLEDDMARTCIPTNAVRMPNGRFPFFRLTSDGRHVQSHNGAALRTVTGTYEGVPYMTLPALAAKVVGICEAPGGAVVVVCEDGGTIDVAA